MNEASGQIAQRVATLLTVAVKTVMLYPQAHPAVRQSLQELADILAALQQENREIHLGVVEGSFFLESSIIVSPNPAIADLAQRLSKKRIEALTIYAGVSLDDLFRFAFLLGNRETGAESFSGELEKNGIRTIRLGIDQLAYGGTAEDAGSAPSRTYSDALNAVRETMQEVENGRIPSSDRINSVVNDMVRTTMKDHTTLLGLAMIKDYDNYTFNHSVNVGILALSFGSYLGLEREALKDVATAGLLHDIGKTKVDKFIVNKPGKLSSDEFEQMKKHPEMGAEIVGQMKGLNTQVTEAVLGHHIKHNRTGYPEWASHQSFGNFAELVAVSDCYDAITTLRAYSVPTSPKAAIDIMRRLSGTSLNRELVEKFEQMMGRYPVGTLVRLDTNEIALVVKPNPVESVKPALKVIIDAQGVVLENPVLKSLILEDGSCYASIVSEVDPLLKNLDIASYMQA